MWKDIIKIREEINEMETNKTITESWKQRADSLKR
jgi:hypothetical protein